MATDFRREKRNWFDLRLCNLKWIRSINDPNWNSSDYRISSWWNNDYINIHSYLFDCIWSSCRWIDAN